MKRFLAAALAATTLLGTALPTMADTTTVQNLTAADAKYSESVILGDTSKVTFSVANADASWSPVAMTDDEVEEITWKVLDGSLSGITYKYDSVEMGTGYKSVCTVDVADVVTDGLAVIEAANPSGGYVDFTIAVNPTDSAEKSVSRVQCRLLDANGNAMAAFKNMQVKSTASTDGTTYVSAMDAIASLAGQKDENDNAVGSVNIAYGMMNSITINNVSYPNDGTYWLYRVYDENGNIYPLSEKAGAGVMKLNAGDIVVWKLGDYSTMEFPTSVPTEL